MAKTLSLKVQDDTKRFYAGIWPHAAAVLRAAQFLSRDDTEADDLAQEVMLKAFRHLDQFREGTSVKAWLMTILHNSRVDRLRSAAARSKDISLVDLPSDPVAREQTPIDPAWMGPETVLQEFSDRQVIDALKKLPDEIRWTLLLVDVEGLDQVQAAQILDVPVGTIKSRTHRGRAMLREALTPLAKELRLTR